MDERMTLGQFSARARLSRKALRVYEAQGLLLPVHVDPRNGYRFYTENQVHRARLIGLLRRLDMPLGRIAAVLDLRPRDACDAIQSYWRELDELHAGRHQLVRYLQELLSERRDEMYDVRTRDVVEQKVLSTRRHLTVRHLPSYIGESCHRLTKHLAASGATVDGPGFVIFHGVVDETSDGPVEVALPCSGTVEPHEDLGVRLEPARTEAFTTITKAQVSFPEILRAYDAVEAWLTEHGLTMALSPREVYFVEDWAAAADDAPVCDVAFPYALHPGSAHTEPAGSASVAGP